MRNKKQSNQPTYQVRGEIRSEDVLRVIVHINDLSKFSKIEITMTDKDMNEARLYDQGKLEAFSSEYNTLKKLDFASPNRHVIQELYTSLKPYLVKDTSRI